MEDLCKNWKLVKSPLSCRQSILEEIQLRFRQNGSVEVFDTANSTRGKFTLINEILDKNTGTINMTRSGWTERARLWHTEEELREARNIDLFIHSLIKDPLNYRLNDGILCIYYNDEEY